jgi:hypothetical protein
MMTAPEWRDELAGARETRETLDEMAHWRERLDKALSALRREIDQVQGIIDERRDHTT